MNKYFFKFLEGNFHDFKAILDNFNEISEFLASFQFDLVPESCPETIWRQIYDPETFGMCL